MLETSAEISRCGQYRYTLSRRWGERHPRFLTYPRAVFIMLNPSTADAKLDDPTIRRCIGFAKAWGLRGMDVVNLYALRSTDPKALWTHDDPVGPENDRHIRDAIHHATTLIAAWGVNAKPDRAEQVRQIAMQHGKSLFCLGATKDGHPRHPLYVRADTPRIPWPLKEPTR